MKNIMSNKKVLWVAIVLGLAVLFVLGYAFGRGLKTYEVKISELIGRGHEEMNHTEMEHEEHPTVKVFNGWKEPKVTLNVTKDSMSGYNLEIQTVSFFFTPKEAGMPNKANSGHAHVFVNGEKVMRAYGNFVHLDQKYFRAGTNTVEVSLNTNNHETWAKRDGSEISATTEVIVK